MAVKVTTNNVPRLTLEAYELTTKEREQFDYLDWQALEDGSDSATFFRYRNNTYDLSDFQSTNNLPAPINKWDGYFSDSFYSGILVRYMDDAESLIVGTYYAD